MRGSSSKVWNDAGEGTVHSKVVAPSPQGLSPVFSGERKRVCQAIQMKKTVEARVI